MSYNKIKIYTLATVNSILCYYHLSPLKSSKVTSKLLSEDVLGFLNSSSSVTACPFDLQLKGG